MVEMLLLVLSVMVVVIDDAHCYSHVIGGGLL